MRGTQTPKIQREDVEYVCEACKQGFYTERGLERHQQRNCVGSASGTDGIADSEVVGDHEE